MNYEPPDYNVPICPVCGRECETIYKDSKSGEIIGCDECISECMADDCEECFPEEKLSIPN